MTTQTPDRILFGMFLMVGFCVIAPLIDVFAKLAGQTVPTGIITLIRFLVQAALMAPLAVALGVSLRLPAAARRLLAARAAVTICATYCFVAALTKMPIADALAIAFVEPFIILLIGKFALHQAIGPRRLGAAIVGFIGALMVIQPSFSVFGLHALYPLGCAFFFALYILITRALSPLIHPIPMQCLTALVAALFCLPLLVLGESAGLAGFAMIWPSGTALLWCVLVGVAGASAHLFMTYALQFAPSSTLAPVHYLEMVTAALFGYLVFGDFPDALTWAGIVVIVGSGLYILHRQHRVGL